MTAPDRPGTPQVLAHGQAEYERSAREAEPWHGPLPAWDELDAGQRSGWASVQGLLSTDQRPHCFGPEGPMVIEWSGRHHAWVHTDGYPCPDSERRPAPETAEAVLFR